jgi:hypothetical protein
MIQRSGFGIACETEPINQEEMTMTTEMLTRRYVQTILALVVILGTATLAILALGVFLLAALLLKTLFDCLVSLVQTVNGLVATGGPFVRLLLLVALLYLAWKAAPRVLRFFRRELAWMQAQFTPSSPAPGKRQAEEGDVSEQDNTVEGTVSQSGETGQTAKAAQTTSDPRRGQAQTSARANSRHRATLPTILKHLASAKG